MSPYIIIYGKTCHLPLELEYKAYWVINTTEYGYYCYNRIEEVTSLWDRRVKIVFLWKFKNIQEEDQAMSWQGNPAEGAHSKSTNLALSFKTKALSWKIKV